jgi:hypothetical protein
MYCTRKALPRANLYLQPMDVSNTEASAQGLTLVHVSAQLEHFQTHPWVKMGYVRHKDSSS